MKHINTVIAAVLFVPLLSSAQEDPVEIVVTPNRVAQSVDSLAVATTVITRQEIEASMAQDLNDLLIGEAGITLARSGGPGGQTSLFLRGTESDHTLVLIDGVQVTTATGGAARLEFISLDQIERIEIVRGPRSGVYGSEAIGGVLQIFTREAAESSFQGSARVRAGTEQTAEGNLSLGGRGAGVDWSVSVAHSETDGFDASTGGSYDRDGFENDSVALSLTSRLTEGLELSLDYSRFDALAEYDDGEVGSDGNQLRTGLRYTVNDAWSGSVSYEWFRENNENAAAFGTTESRSETRALRWRNDVELAETALLSLGVDRQEQSLRYDTFGAEQSGRSRDNTGVYGVYLYSHEALDIEVSVRSDDNEHFGRHETGSLAAGWRFDEENRVYASAGTAFKAPNLIDLYVDFPAFFFFANPDLEPEKSRNLEIGFETRSLGGELNVNVFHNRIRDLIASDATFTSLANVERAEIKGLEVTMLRELLGWNLQASLTLLDHENRTSGARLLRRPDESFSLQARRQFAAFELGFDWLAQSEHADVDPLTFGSSEVAGYGRLDVTMAYRPAESIVLRMKLGNVFDRAYQVVDGYNSYGRHALLSMEYAF